MDYFEGENLESYVANQGPLLPQELLAVARQVAEALQAAHAKGIFHRDVKPGNILVKREGEEWRVKLIDFGLALRSSTLDGQLSTQGPRAQTTIGKSIAGTMNYAAPEQMGQLPGVPVGPYSDVYGFGKTCYYALKKTPDPDDGEKAELPDDWRQFLSNCTRTAKENRLPDFAAVLANLREIDTGLVNVDGDTGRPPDAAELAIRPKTVLHLDPGQVIGKQPSEPEKNVVVIAARLPGTPTRSITHTFVQQNAPSGVRNTWRFMPRERFKRMFPRF